MTLLRVHNLGKSYRTYRSEWQRFACWFGLPMKPSQEHWVLRHVSFEVQAGKAVGIIGKNGAGKSTLLKMIVDTLQPTEGSVEINGTVAAMLELGMGFHPELTGRQNAYHVGSLMGFSKQKIKEAMPDIEAFAEIGDAFDQAMRAYSSGMHMRVAFSLATAFRPDILIVDEALSVGDSYFQHKSFNRIREFQAQGTTLLIVSHDRAAIQSLCDRAILIDNGTAIQDGKPEEVFDFYNALIAEQENSTITIKRLQNGKAQTRSGSGEVRIKEITLYNSQGKISEHLKVGEPFELQIAVKVHKAVETLVLGYSIKDHLGQLIYGTNTWHTNQIIQKPEVGNEYLFIIASTANLGVGSYSVQIALVDRDTHMISNYEWRDLALVFNVINVDKPYFIGCLWHQPTITITEGI